MSFQAPPLPPPPTSCPIEIHRKITYSFLKLAGFRLNILKRQRNLGLRSMICIQTTLEILHFIFSLARLRTNTVCT
jgi:hypothetical protein